jgi:hypothetical protein
MDLQPSEYDRLLSELAADFDALANILQQAIEVQDSGNASLDALMSAKAAAEKGAELARRNVQA